MFWPAVADRKITDLTALTTPASADVLPIVDVSEAAAADKNKKITVGELFKGVPDGTAAAPAIAFESDDGNGIFLSTTDTVGIATNGFSRMTVSTTAVTSTLPVIVPDGTDAAPSVAFTGSGTDTGVYSPGVDQVAISTGGTGRLFINSAGNVGIGVTNPGLLGENLYVLGKARFQESASSGAIAFIGADATAAYFDTGTYGVVQPIAFRLNGDEKARIDSSGRLLVGTTTSTGSNELLQSYSTNGNNLGIGRFTSASSTFGSEFNLHRSRGALGTNTSILTGDTIGTINFKGADGTSYLTAASIAAFADAGVNTDDMPGRLVFSTTADGASSPTERMRISENGRVRFFSSDEGIQSNVAGSSKNLFTCTNNSTSTTTGTLKFVVRADGDCENTNNSYGGISDIKLKENIVDASSQWDDLKAIQVRNYNFKEETGHQTHTQLGVIAQEIELVSPGLVRESPDRDEEGNDLGTVTKSVNYSVLYMKAVKALQEAMERIETLEQRLNDAGIA